MNLKLKLTSAAALLLGALSIAPTFAQETPEFDTVSGSVAYLQRIAMPPDAVLTVRVEDVSRADAHAPILAETREPFGTRQVPIAFSLKVPSAAIDPRFSYAVHATIKVGGELRFTTTRSYPVLTRGAPNQVDLVLDAVPSTPAETTMPAMEAAPMANLKDTYWKLVELDGARIVTASPQKREVRITIASEGSRVIGFSGCNQFTGGYTQDGNTLRFTQMAGTQMACVPPVMKLESQVLKMLNATTGYHVEGEHLTLLADTQVLARFEAVYLR